MNGLTISRWKWACIVALTIPLLLAIWLPMIALGAAPTPTSTTLPSSTAQSTTTASATVQLTPTVDPTVIALQKAVLEHQNNWLWGNAVPLVSTLLSGPAILFTALFGLFRWRKDQQIERDKRAEDRHMDRQKRDEDRFQAVVEGLGSERVEAQVGAAIMLRTFLRPGYEQFYRQTFDLAIAHLRLREVDPVVPAPLDSLSQALITVLKESFPEARRVLKSQVNEYTRQLLDATGAHLDNAYLSNADLSEIFLRKAIMREAHFWKANLRGAYLKHSNLASAYLVEANLQAADCGYTVLTNADLRDAQLEETHLSGADLTGADLKGAHPEKAASLNNAKLNGVKGLTPDQLAACAARGAKIDDSPSP